MLKLEVHADDICKSCPKLHNGICINNDKVRKKDEFIIDLLTTDEIAVKDAYQRIKTLEEERFKNLCQNCEWYDLGFCLEGFRKMKQKEN
ncbi:hypothetical protein JOD02_002049 [Caldicoprobacter guelmensis]|nr:hypothetical protein [Caldicoprobacter guelmensis]